jgi:acyl-CoA thioester hydrolase
MARTLETPIQKRFSDVDPFQHVNNVSQQMYFDVGKMEFYEKVLGAEVLLADLRILTVSTSTSYLGQVRMHDPVRVTTTCERVGTKSLTLFQQLLASAQLNSLALTGMCHASLPYMHAGSSIINMGSNSAWQPVPYQAVYGASKSYVLSLSRAIGRELRPQGIHVMCVCPGWIKTEFQQVAHHDEYIRYVDKWYGPDEVAAQAMQDLKKKKSVSILGHPVRRQVRLVKLLPVDTVMDIWCKQQGIE